MGVSVKRDVVAVAGRKKKTEKVAPDGVGGQRESMGSKKAGKFYNYEVKRRKRRLPSRQKRKKGPEFWGRRKKKKSVQRRGKKGLVGVSGEKGREALPWRGKGERRRSFTLKTGRQKAKKWEKRGRGKSSRKVREG